MKRRAFKGVKLVHQFEQVENVVESKVISFEDTKESKTKVIGKHD